MGNHSRVDYENRDLSVPGHTAHIVYIPETRDMGLHCDEDGWFAGGKIGKPGRWRDKHMAEAWQKHLDHAATGAVIVHERPENVDEGICQCVRCLIPWRMAKNAAEAK